MNFSTTVKTRFNEQLERKEIGVITSTTEPTLSKIKPPVGFKSHVKLKKKKKNKLCLRTCKIKETIGE